MRLLQRLGVISICALGLAGCACEGYKQALRSVRDVGPRIEADIKPADAGGEARKQAFHDLLQQLNAMDLGR